MEKVKKCWSQGGSQGKIPTLQEQKKGMKKDETQREEPREKIRQGGHHYRGCRDAPSSMENEELKDFNAKWGKKLII